MDRYNPEPYPVALDYVSMRQGRHLSTGSSLADFNRKGLLMKTYELFVGPDIAAETASVAWHHSQTQQSGQMEIAQKQADYNRLRRQLIKLADPAQTLVVMEATGNYWLALALFLHQAGFVVSVINPIQSRRFADMQLQRTKTDATDAHRLAQFAQMIQPEPWTPPPAICEQLQQRLAQREDFLHMRTQERNRLHALRHNPNAEKSVVRRIERHIRYLNKEIDTLKKEIEVLLQSDHAWGNSAHRLLTVNGFGTIVTAWILVATHNFARCDTPEQAASFAGLAPHARDSGSSLRGKRSIGGSGHAALRKALYMAAGSATRYNPPIKTFYDRLVQNGKRKKVARCAAARKLMHIAWAVVVKERDFDPNYQAGWEIQQIAA